MRLKNFLAGALLGLSLGVGALAAFSPSPALAQSAVLLPNGKQQFLDSNGAPLAGGSVGFYVPPATLTPKTTWIDAARATPNSNPVTLDSSGEAVIYGVGSYRQIVKDALGATIWDAQTSGLGGSTYGGTSTGTANAQILSASDFASVDGSVVTWTAGFTNTGPLTLDAGFGVKTVVKNSTSGPTPLVGGEVIAAGFYAASWSVSNNRFTLLTYTPIAYETRFPEPYNAMLSTSVAGGSLTISLVGVNGAVPSTTNPVVVPMDATNGTVSAVSFTAPVTLTIPASCSLGYIGTNGATAPTLWVYLIYPQASTPVLGVTIAPQPVFDNFFTAVNLNTAACNVASQFYIGTVASASARPMTLVGALGTSYSTVSGWGAAGVQKFLQTPSLRAVAGSLLSQTASVTLSNTSVNLPGPLQANQSVVQFQAYPATAKKERIVIRNLSTTGVSPLIITPNVCSGGFVSTGSTLSAAAVASTSSTTQALLSNVQVAANTYSGYIDITYDMFTAASPISSFIYSAHLISSGSAQIEASGSCTGAENALSTIVLSTSGGADTFDSGTAYAIVEF